ncbi:MAG: hypothetical protein RIQ93_2911 [Verrucomicrobiota bacterium]|jgi:drug/metabolite transporter (DMT)-like permease
MNSTALSSRARDHRLGVVLMLVSAACFSVNVLLIRALGSLLTVNVWLVSSARFAIGLVVIFAVYRREVQPAHLFRNPKLVGRGLVGGLGTFLLYLTIVHLGAGRATFINNTYVILGALLAVVMLGEKFRAALAVGGLATLVGLALLTNAFSTHTPPSIYDLLAFLGACASAYVVVTIRQLHATEHTSTIFAAQCVYGLFLCAGPALFEPMNIGPLAWAIMAVASAVAAVGQITMTGSFRHLAVAEGSLLQMLTPLGIAVGGFAFFHERFSPQELIGALLILIATIFVALRR